MYRLVLLLVALGLTGCTDSLNRPGTIAPGNPGSGAPSLENIYRGTDAISGWAPDGEARFYNPENLYDLVDGQADAFFAYGMRQVAVRRYQDAEGKRLDVEVWQLATPADAYGLFTASVSGQPIAIGNEGDIESGVRVSFWQESFVVHVGARQNVDDALLTSFAAAIAQELPKGGARPALVERLPQTGLESRRFVFFHKEISIQDQLWLGGKNVLGLGPDTEGLLARYDLDGHPAHLLIVRYLTAAQATTGLAALQSTQLSDLQAAQARDSLLGAVFGGVDAQAAHRLLAQALSN